MDFCIRAIVIAGAATASLAAPALAGTYKVIYSFTGGADGGRPEAGLINIDGTLYGTTNAGGNTACGGGCGTVFSVDPISGIEKVIYAFKGAPDGSGPFAPLSKIGTKVYGTTYDGGIVSPFAEYGSGTVFSVQMKSGIEHTDYSFQFGSDGSGAVDGMVKVGNLVYGVTEGGGAKGLGIIYSFDPKTHVEKVVHTFAGSDRSVPIDGALPAAGLINVKGVLYGTTLGGGSNHNGTVYSFNPETGLVRVLHSFNGNDGSAPTARLLNVGDTLYGTTLYGAGASGSGAIFSINLQDKSERTLYKFQDGNDGGFPYGTLIKLGPVLYGTTLAGGTGNHGVIYSIDPKSGQPTTLHSFAGGSDGSGPETSLLNVNGVLYGTAGSDPGSSSGSIFSYTP